MPDILHAYLYILCVPVLIFVEYVSTAGYTNMFLCYLCCSFNIFILPEAEATMSKGIGLVEKQHPRRKEVVQGRGNSPGRAQ